MPRNFQPPLKKPPLTSIPLPPTSSALPASSAISKHASDGHSPSAVSKKRRNSATISTRGVANLTPEQLAKKRANDREAQRAIRERTKTQIESLEKKIEELSNQQPHQELQTVIEQKQRVESENVQIKQKLGAAVSLLQPLLQAAPPGQSSVRFARTDRILIRLFRWQSTEYTRRLLRRDSAHPYFRTPQSPHPPSRISVIRRCRFPKQGIRISHLCRTVPSSTETFANLADANIHLSQSHLFTRPHRSGATTEQSHAWAEHQLIR